MSFSDSLRFGEERDIGERDSRGSIAGSESLLEISEGNGSLLSPLTEVGFMKRGKMYLTSI